MAAGTDGTWLAQAYDADSRKQTRRSLGAFDHLPANKRFDAASEAAREWFKHLDLGGGTEKFVLFSTSADGQTWQPAEPEKKDSHYTLTIPANCLASGSLHLRLERCAVSGFTLGA